MVSKLAVNFKKFCSLWNRMKTKVIRGKKVTLKWSKILSVVGGGKGKVDTIKILGA